MLIAALVMALVSAAILVLEQQFHRIIDALARRLRAVYPDLKPATVESYVMPRRVLISAILGKILVLASLAAGVVAVGWWWSVVVGVLSNYLRPA
jgi:hypothetical protein